MSEIVAATIGIIGTLLVSIISYIGAKKAGVGPFQATLEQKLKDILDVQEKEINNLKTKNLERDTEVIKLQNRISELEFQVDALKELTVTQAFTITELKKSKQPSRRSRAAAQPAAE